MNDGQKVELTEEQAGALKEKNDRFMLEVSEKLPEVVKWCDEAIRTGAEWVAIHQDAFALDYNIEEIKLLGMAVKYVGLRGLGFTVSGLNGETVYKLTFTP